MTDKAIEIFVNDEPRQVADGTSCRDVVAQLVGKQIGDDGVALDGTALGVALALNSAVIPRSSWAETTLADGARLEVITAVQGG